MIIDVHSHILPKIDDGSASIKESIEMLRMEAQQGIEHVIATPHFYAQHDSPENFLARRKESEARLREEMVKHVGLPKLSVGAEVYYYRGISDSDILQALTIGGNSCILIEMQGSPWTNSMFKELEDIRVKHGLTPIVAHVDRYISPFKTHGIPEKLAKMPVYVQANASFFLHKTTARMALRMLRNNKIHLLGSDCHNMTLRKPNLGDAVKLIEQRLGKGAIGQINYYEHELLNSL